MPGRRLAAALAAAAAVALAGAPAAAAPTPTPTPPSPTAKVSLGPLGGRLPDGAAVGGESLLTRRVVQPAGTARLPAGISAHAWLVADLDSGAVLAARDAHGRYAPASILKVLTATALMPIVPPTAMVPVSKRADLTEGSYIGIVAGGKYRADLLFASMLMQSGNDAAVALAEAAGGLEAGLAAMNATAQRLGAYDTYAATPSGLDGPGQLTTAYDMTLILRAAIDQPAFVKYARTLDLWLPAQRIGKRPMPAIPVWNHAEDFIKRVPGAIAAKNGFTDEARQTYVCAATRNGRRLGVVFLRNTSAKTQQWQQAAALLDWAQRLPAGASVGNLVSPIAPAPTAPVTTDQAPPPPTTAAAPRPTAAAPAVADGATASAPHPPARSLWQPLGLATGLVACAGAAAFAVRRVRS